MSDNIPTDPALLTAEIEELLEVTPITSERGRLFHLLNAAINNAGGGGGSSVTNIIELGTFTLAASATNLAAQECFISNTQLIFSNQTGSSPADQLPFAYTSLLQTKDFDFILSGELGGGFSFSFTLDAFTIHSGSSSNNRTFVGHNTMIAPIPAGTSITIHAVPKTKGSNNPYGTSAGLLFDLNLIDVSAADAATFNTDNLSAVNGDAGFNQANLATNAQMFIKVPQATWDLISVQFQSNIISPGTATASIIVYDRGEFQGAIFGFFDSTRSYDSATGIMTLTFENNGTLSPSTLTFDAATSAINVRLFADYGA